MLQNLMRLKATKTSLYQLVSVYEALPPMSKTVFTKAYRSPDWWLRWMDADGLSCAAFFSTCLGQPLLSVEKVDFDELLSREVYTLDLEALMERGMLESARVAQ